MTNDVLIYSDGSSLGNPGPGGYGVIMKWKDKELKLSQGFRKTTNNRMELLGPIIALKKLKKPENVLITTDSRYVIDGIEKGWAKKWQKNNWMRDRKNKALNSDLWKMLIELCDYHTVNFFWVKGHMGHIENEECDLLAKNAASSNDLIIDEKFESKELSNER
ncbi:MAG: ribonuclease HI [Dehalococcoidales bacterium]|jgi:ribonuclease HI|nr:ribonuclease HI [Dehalococcoidia bacterium]NCG35635.1 ribonuclease HI [Dehalococcoidales bacterium]